MLYQKWKKRNDTFERNKDLLVDHFGMEDECRTFLEKGYMSDEEPFESNAQGQVLSFHRLVPIWRSEKVSF